VVTCLRPMTALREERWELLGHNGPCSRHAARADDGWAKRANVEIAGSGQTARCPLPHDGRAA